MRERTGAARWKVLVAFAVIYLVWGTTFLAIRVGVLEVPPLLFAAMRFVVAGVVLYGWMMARGERGPKGREWGSIALLAALIFVVDYGLLFWAEQRVPSGVAAILLATIPLFTAVAEMTLLRTRKMTVRLGFALMVGLGGVMVLTSRALNVGGAVVDRVGAAAIIVGSLSWSVASVLSRRLPLPAGKAVSSGAQMLVGGAMLAVLAGATGELRGFAWGAVSHGAWVALAYLIVAGSIIGFTAYVWLIDRESPTKVATYAYVNPVVAVLAGYWFGGEGLGVRTVIGAGLVLVSVVVIVTAGASKVVAAEQPE